MDLPSLESLRCFDAAARSPTFRAAAKLVSLTPAAFGQRIQQLEEQLGAPLFVRTTRSLALSPAGLALVPAAREALEAARSCIRAAKGETAPLPVELTLGTRYELGLSFLLPMHDTIVARHPGVTLHFHFSSGPDLLFRVRSREIDFAVTSTRVSDPQLETAQLHREEYVFVGSRGLLARTPLRRDADAPQHTLIDIAPELPLFQYWREAPDAGDRLRFKQIWHVGTGEAVRRFVLAGRGVAVLPHYMVHKELACGRLQRVFPKMPLQSDHFRLVFRADDPRRPLFEAIAGTLRSAPLQ